MTREQIDLLLELLQQLENARDSDCPYPVPNPSNGYNNEWDDLRGRAAAMHYDLKMFMNWGLTGISPYPFEDDED